jgi:radical SAM protein with 4Fe4S-binding SPASM domain
LTSGLTALIVAIDSLEQDRYEIYRVGGKLSTAVDGVKRLVDMKKRLGSETLINLRMVIMKQNEHELPNMRRFARRAGVDCFTVKTLNPSCGLDSEDSELVPADERYRRYDYHQGTFERVRIDTHCRKMWFMCNVFADGEVVPCGYDFDARLKVGNVNDTPLSKLWNSPEAIDIRKKIYFQKDSIPLCRECTVNYKLSKNGWFPEKTDFNKKPLDRCMETLQQYYDDSPELKRILSQAPALKKNLRRFWDFVKTDR